MGNSQNPVAYLIEWRDYEGQPCRRVQLTPDLEPWLERHSPKVTPLVRAASQPDAGREKT